MSNLKNYISKKLDIILESDKKSPSEIEKKLKSLGLPPKALKKAMDRVRNSGFVESPKSDDIDVPANDVLSGRIHSDDEIKNIVQIRKLFKNKSAKLINDKFQTEKENFINHYDNLFNNGASELPGILEFYSVASKRKRIRPAEGQGFIFKMEPEDAKKYGKDIVKYFLVKNSDIFPTNRRAKMALNSYLELMAMSGVDASYVDKTKSHYYKKYNLDQV